MPRAFASELVFLYFLGLCEGRLCDVFALSDRSARETVWGRPGRTDACLRDRRRDRSKETPALHYTHGRGRANSEGPMIGVE